VKEPYRSAALAFLCAVTLIFSLDGCASLQPAPRFRTSSSSFAPDQVPDAQRDPADLSDPAKSAAYTALKNEHSERPAASGSIEEVRQLVINQTAEGLAASSDEIGLDVEDVDDELAGEDLIAEQADIQDATIEEIMRRGTALSASDALNEINPAVNRPELIREIVNLLGIRYHYGGTDATRGLDCSAFTGTIFSRALGKRLPRSSGQQFQVGSAVVRDDLKIGDLVFFHTLRRRANVTHVGIYVGEGLFAHASSKFGVIVSSLEHPFYKRAYVGARRIMSTEMTEASARR
jgi:cell wall-associated NlpC family hydrolase